MTHYLPLYFPEAERFANSSRTEWYTQLLLLTPCPSAVLAYLKVDFIAVASRVSGRKCDKRRLLAEFYETAKKSVGLPISEASDATNMFRLVLREFSALCAVRR